MTDPIDLLDEASWTGWPKSHWGDSEWLVTDAGIATVGDLRRLLALARDGERLRAALTLAVRTIEWSQGFVVDEVGALETWHRGCDPVLSKARAALEGTDR